VRDRATERFFRREGEPEEGFGLGLAIAAEALAATGAAFELESAPGSGTTARMTFRAGHLVAT
jgi:signal transduction histidine kinase